MTSLETIKILFVEDVPEDVEVACGLLDESPFRYDYSRVDTEPEFLRQLEEFRPDIIISDYSMPEFDGLKALVLALENSPDTPVIIFTGSINESTAVECMKSGAYDYILKENMTRLPYAILEALEKKSMREEQVKAVNALKESEEKFRSYIDNAPIGVVIADTGGKFVDCNKGAEEVFGYPPYELIGLTIPDLLSEDSQEQGRAHFNQVITTGSASGELLLKRKDRTAIWVYFTAVKLTDDRFMAYCEDISERKIAEIELHKSEEKHRRIFESIQDVYYETTPDGVILEVSPSISLLSKGNYSPTDLIGKSILDFYVIPEEREVFLSQLMKTGNVPDYEIHLRNKDGNQIPCSLSSKLLLSETGKPEKIIGTLRDSTERKKYEGELILAKERAEESDRLKSAFLANMSHEIRTPLNGILGFAEILKDPELTAGERDNSIVYIRTCSDQLLHIIHDIVDISKIEAGQELVKPNDIDLNLFLDEIQALYEPSASFRKIGFSIKREFGQHGASIRTDSWKLKKIFLNLIGNALKFTEQGSVGVNCIIGEGKLSVRITDTGIGIEAGFLAVIFDRFRQAELGMARKYGGMGLGLAITKSYVELLGGHITVESEPGRGSVFSFEIPFQHTLRPEGIKSESPSGKLKSPVDIRQTTILVAEDEDTNAHYLNMILSKTGAKILIAENGKIAVEMFTKTPEIHFVFMDIKMPVMDGVEAAMLIKKHRPDVPVIALTAYALADERKKLLQQGFDGYLSKPVSKETILETLYQYI